MATLRSAKQTTGQPKRSRFLTSLATSAIMLASLLGVSAAYPQATAQAVTCVSADRNVTGIENLTATPPEYATIGAAVTAASPGEQICIGAGTWPEQVTISKELTLTGAGELITIISSPAVLAPVCGTDLANYGNSVAIVDICGAVANVTISELTIDGDWDGAGPLSGMPASGRSEFFGLVVHGGATATISNLTVTNINQANSGSWGAQQGRAVWVGPASTLSATNIHVLRYQKSGIFASGGSGALGAVATLNLSDSLVEGDQLAGMNSAIAMNGITIIGADATLNGVTSRGNKCDVASCGFTGFTSGGLLIYDRAGVVPAMHVYISANIFQDNDWGVYTRVRKIDSSVEVNGNDISLNRYVGLEVNEGNATFSNNDFTDNGIVGIELTSGIEGVAPVHATFVQNLVKGNGGVHAASSAIRLVENPGFASRASLLFSSNAIIDNAGVTVAHLSYSGAPLSIDEVITGTGTWWGDSVQPGDASMNFTSNLATLSDALATDSSDASYGFIVSSVAIESSVDLPPLTIASSDRAAMPTPISIDFGAISGGGTVTAVLSEQPAEGNISFGTNPSVVDIDFTGTFTGSVEICIGYDPAQYYAGSSILLFHFIGGTWVDVTSSVDESTRRVCGLVSSFSPFAAGEELAVYAITYDANDGTLAGGEDPSYTYGDAAITAPSDPTRTGYDFAGWFRDDITFATSAFPLTPTGDTTVYAKWDIDVYTITYDANDGTLAGGEDPSYTYGDAAITAPSDPTRTGYDFAGWFRDDITFATSAFPLTPTGDTTVYAKWDIDVYTITYDANDGTLAGGEDPSYTYGEPAIIAPTDPTRTGYDFAGWYTDDITFASSAFPLTPTADTTVYAKWTASTYTVTYDTNSGTLFGGEITSYTTGDAAISQPTDPTRTGYAFVDWYSDALFATVATWPLTPTEDTTVYAKWTSTGGGGGGGGGTSGPLNLSTPILSGYTSVGSSITASPGTWTTATSFAYHWYRCSSASPIAQVEIPTNCTFITSDVGATYVIQAADLGTWIRVRVRAQVSGATTSLFSATTAAVGPKPASIKARPPRVTNGLAAVGSTLASKRGQWNNVGATYTYQWYRCTKFGLKNPKGVPLTCTAITGAASKTYTVKAADRGFYLRVRVTATGPTGQGFRMSQSTGYVPN